ncbi:unnamed protein product [Schistosoma mattheei]|uniref:Uncharacterized protein n=1 Tax=Schistosoma mattheei TaxID=31246 RepID=A0A183PWG9_9TREM|nr:unnamed protein product [Schistosoma mattheei]
MLKTSEIEKLSFILSCFNQFLVKKKKKIFSVFNSATDQNIQQLFSNLFSEKDDDYGVVVVDDDDDGGDGDKEISKVS